MSSSCCTKAQTTSESALLLTFKIVCKILGCTKTTQSTSVLKIESKTEKSRYEELIVGHAARSSCCTKATQKTSESDLL